MKKGAESEKEDKEKRFFQNKIEGVITNRRNSQMRDKEEGMRKVSS